jgi:hypothetical protein
MEAWGFTYKTNIVWHKIRKDGGSDGRGVGFYFRNVTELVLLACAARMRGRSLPGADRSTTLPPKRGSIRESLMSFIPLSKSVLRGPMQNCLRADYGRDGKVGVTRARFKASVR